MAKCIDCSKGVGGHPGSACPLASKLPSTWAGGCSLASPRDQPALAVPATITAPPVSRDRTRTPRAPNKTEADYQRQHLAGRDARFEAVTFRMANGHRYTPDWVVFEDGRPTECHECKGGYALHSQQRARLAFDQALVEYPGLQWVWAVKTADGWKVDSAPTPLGTLRGIETRTGSRVA